MPVLVSTLLAAAIAVAGTGDDAATVQEAIASYNRFAQYPLPPLDSEQTQRLLSAFETVNANFNNVRIVARSDQAAIQAETVAGLSPKQAMFAPRQLTEVVERLLMRV